MRDMLISDMPIGKTQTGTELSPHSLLRQAIVAVILVLIQDLVKRDRVVALGP